MDPRSPSDPDWGPALEAFVARTGFERFRWLCSDANRHGPPFSRESYRRFVAGATAGRDGTATDPPPTPADLALRAHLAAHGCGCGGG
jgi:hypothetical protein